MEEGSDVRTTTPLFINEALPPAQYFKDLVPMNNYIVNQLKLQQVVADNQLKIGRSAYVPNIALFGKQTLYADGLDKYLLPRTMVGVGFTWNIFDGLNREKTIRQAKIASQSLRLGKEKAITDLEVGIDKFYSQLQNALDNVNEPGTGPGAEEILPRGNGYFYGGSRCRGYAGEGEDRFSFGLLSV